MLAFGQEPMLARSASRLPASTVLPGGCVYEPKFDGYRAMLYLDERRCRVQSRRGHNITDAFVDVATAAFEQLPAGLVLDGELVVHGDDGLDFTELQRRLASPAKAARRAKSRPASFVAFDVLHVDDVDARARTLAERRTVLEAVLADATPPLELAPQTADPETAAAWLADFADTHVGLEGVVVKGNAQTYRGGRRDWIKVRVRDTLEAIVGAVTGSLSAPDRLVLGRYDTDGELLMLGSTGPLNAAAQRAIAPLLAAETEMHPWPAEVSSGRLGAWGGDRQVLHRVHPDIVVEVSVDNSIDSIGRWRHIARFQRLRTDLTPEEVPGASQDQ